MLLKDLTTLTASLVSGTLFHVEKSGKAYNIDYTKLAKAIVEEYNGSTLGGSAQTIQAAITALNSSLMNNTYTPVTIDSTKFENFSWEPVAYCRIGNIIFVHGAGQWIGESNPNGTVFASGLPGPRQNAYFACPLNSRPGSVNIGIDYSGTLKIYSNDSNISSGFYVCFSYTAR
jgi:hypothetical protein